MMRKIYLTLAVFISFITLSKSQILEGVISDNDGKTVPYATVYVKDIKFGTTSNELGQYKLKLKSGDYTISFQSLGFETVEKKVSILESSQTLNIKLNIKSYQLAGVKIKPNAEDPAYSIIRKAIGMAPFYQNQVKEFEAEVYMKGSIKVVKLSWIVKKATRKEKDAPKEGELYLQESLNNIHFTAPDKYDQTVKMIRSNFPTGDSNDDNAMEFINASLYQPKIGEIILPLSPYALNHYKFRYEGYSKEGDRIVNKIKIIPKRKSKQLVDGYLYIADKFWNLHSADLSVESLVGTIKIQQTFAEVEKNVWLPINHNFDILGKFMGNEGNIRYVSSVKYKTVSLNNDIKVPANLVSEKVQEKLEEPKILAEEIAKSKTSAQTVKDQKRKEKIEKLLEKEDLNNREMYQLATLMEKDAKEADTTKKSLEIKETHKVKVDSIARKADTTMWNKIRPIALTPDEVNGMEDLRKSVAKKDSSELKKDTLKKEKNIFLAILTGNNWRNKEKKQTISFSGIINTDQLRFNTVDGFVTGMSLSYRKTINDFSFNLNPQVAYAFNREAIMGKMSGGFSHSPSRRGFIGFSLGSESVDFNQESGINTFGNSIASLAYRLNYKKLYEHRYFGITNRIDISNGFLSNVAINFYDRTMLENSTDFSFYSGYTKEYTPNFPVNDTIYGNYTPNHKALILKLGFSFTPEYFYRMYDNRKYMVSSKYPTFSLDSRIGIPNIAGSDVKFLQVEVGVRQSIKSGPSNKFNYKLAVGDFLIKDNLYFPDFRHFNTQEIPVVFGDFANSFQLLEYYKHSTNSQYFQGFVGYQSPFLVLKLLPWFSNRIWMENLYLASLATKGSKPYWEAGYSITQISIFGGVGVFVGFEGQKFSSYGVKISIALDGEVSI
ncbi:MAG: DUF5686 and carboxypeptidase regulatory-like domain-containing protein [Tenuifilaceae bacterium]